MGTKQIDTIVNGIAVRKPVQVARKQPAASRHRRLFWTAAGSSNAATKTGAVDGHLVIDGIDTVVYQVRAAKGAWRTSHLLAPAGTPAVASGVTRSAAYYAAIADARVNYPASS